MSVATNMGGRGVRVNTYKEGQKEEDCRCHASREEGEAECEERGVEREACVQRREGGREGGRATWNNEDS